MTAMDLESTNICQYNIAAVVLRTYSEFKDKDKSRGIFKYHFIQYVHFHLNAAF